MKTTSSGLARFGWAVMISLGCTDTERIIDPADDALLGRRAAYQGLGAEHRLRLAEEGEPGRRLLVLGRLISMEDGRPLADRLISVYQADHRGSYDESVAGEEATARLKGAVRTDHLGRFLISTILPGDYGSTAGNRHIHTTVPGARPEAYDFYFKQYIRAGLRSWARRSDQAVVLDLKRTEEATLLAAADLPVRGIR